MKSGWLRLSLLATMFMFMLAACAPASTENGTGVDGDGVVPATQVVPDMETIATEVTGAGEMAADCVGADTQALMTTGQTLYADGCASCHGAQGEGQGDFPALAANTDVTAENALGLVTGYLSVEAHPKDVAPDDMAAILTYVRGSFGNTGAPICPADVQIPAVP